MVSNKFFLRIHEIIKWMYFLIILTLINRYQRSFLAVLVKACLFVNFIVFIHVVLSFVIFCLNLGCQLSPRNNHFSVYNDPDSSSSNHSEHNSKDHSYIWLFNKFTSSFFIGFVILLTFRTIFWTITFRTLLQSTFVTVMLVNKGIL